MGNLKNLLDWYIRTSILKQKPHTYRSLAKEINIPVSTLHRFINNKEIEAHSLNKILLWLLK